MGRLLHDRTADKIAAVVSRIPHAAATIVPFDVRSRVEQLSRRMPLAQAAASGGMPESKPPPGADGSTGAGTTGAGSHWRRRGRCHRAWRRASRPTHGRRASRSPVT